VQTYEQDVNDVLAALDFVVKRGLVDPSKVAVVGGSHGGFLTTHLIGQVLLLSLLFLISSSMQTPVLLRAHLI
jgi:acetyl esterase/lipase